MIHAVIEGQTYRLDADNRSLIVDDTGGEGVVYWFKPSTEFLQRHGNTRFVLKVFNKAETDAQRRSAHERQTKLREFPTGLPSNVTVPLALAYDHTGRQIIGYVMVYVPNGTKLISFKSANYRENHSVTTERIMRIMANLHTVITAVHNRDAVIGDLNDKNVLVLPNDEVWLLDADSLQFGTWECPAFVPDFVDPDIVRLMPGSPPAFVKIGKHSELTDWYAFTVMLFRLLVHAHPLTDGFYSPPEGERAVLGNWRIQRRISMFNPRVTPPSNATPWDQIPPELVRLFRQVFEEGRRGVFPAELLAIRRPSVARPSARTASAPPPSPHSQFHLRPRPATNPASRKLAVSLQGGRLRYVVHENGAYRREDGKAFWATEYNPAVTAIPAGDRTVMASAGKFVIFDGVRHTDPMDTQVVLGCTTVAANGQHVYWLHQNELVRDDRHGRTVRIGRIAANSTSVWVGERFGVALAQAGVLTKAQTFTERNGFRGFLLPPSFGSVVDAQCAVGSDLAWLTLSISNGGRVVNRCYAFDALAQLRATAEATQGDGSWLGCMTPAAHATGDKLLVPVPQLGIVRIGITGQQARQELVYPATAVLVPNEQATVGLTFSSQGLLHVGVTDVTPITTRI